MSEKQPAFKGYRDDQIGVGNEGNTSKVNEPGTYFDPESEKEIEVTHPAAADALVRMGWVMIRDEHGNKVENRFSRRPEDSPEVLRLREARTGRPALDLVRQGVTHSPQPGAG